MPQVSALYRYPIKGFTPERRESLVVQPDGRVAGDRVLAFRFAMAATPDHRDGLEYWPKTKGLALMDFPSIAPLQLEYDDEALHVKITHESDVLVDVALDDAGREELVETITEFVLSTPEGRRLRGPGRLPLVLVGDGKTARFQDRPLGYVTVHGDGSVAAVEEKLQSTVDHRRFRSNVVVEGLDAWDELGWSGEVRIGDVVFNTEGPIVRCMATHANPDTGIRDAPIMNTLVKDLEQREPTLGRLLLPAGSGGVIRVGDDVVAA